MINKKNEPELVYSHAVYRYLVEVWNQRITYLHKEIYVFDDGVKGTIRHSKYHPDITSAFSFIIDNIFYVSMRVTFGSGTSPSNFESFARRRVHLAHFPSSRRGILEKT